jgi:hypothetical protein
MKPQPLTGFGVERHTLVCQKNYSGSSLIYNIREIPRQAVHIHQLQREVLGRV